MGPFFRERRGLAQALAGCQTERRRAGLSILTRLVAGASLHHLNIGFDPSKNERNVRERGFGFLAAARIFLGHTLERDDLRRDYGERRIQAIGQADGFTYFVVYTWRADADGPCRWIISAHLASRKERERYAAFFADRP